MLNSKKKIITLIIIIIDILALILFISLNSFIKQKDLNTDNIENIYIFRNNKYIVPEGLKYSDYSENLFKIEANDWYALVKIYYDSDKKIWNNSIEDGNEMTIVGTPSLDNGELQLNSKTGNYATIQLDKTKDITIHMVAKAVERSGDNGRFIEIYLDNNFGNRTPTVFINNSTYVGYGIFTNDNATSVSALKYNVMTLTINKDTKEMKFYLNGSYQGSKTLSDYGSALYLAHCNYNSNGMGNIKYKLMAIENSIPTDGKITEIHNNLMQRYEITN